MFPLSRKRLIVVPLGTFLLGRESLRFLSLFVFFCAQSGCYSVAHVNNDTSCWLKLYVCDKAVQATVYMQVDV